MASIEESHAVMEEKLPEDSRLGRVVASVGSAGRC
jgi:hypothetical protein